MRKMICVQPGLCLLERLAVSCCSLETAAPKCTLLFTSAAVSSSVCRRSLLDRVKFAAVAKISAYPL